jgi:CHAD domain-containing protein
MSLTRCLTRGRNWKPMNYQMPDETTGADLSELLQKHYTVKEETTEPCAFTYYDSFDWRFHNRGLHLQHSGRKFTLTNFLESPETEEASLITDYLGRFSWDYPHSGFRDYIAEILDPRALSEITSGTNQITTLHLLNKDEKTVVRVTIEQASIRKGKLDLPLKRRACLHSVRGYENDLNTTRRVLETSGLVICDETLFEEAIRILGISPGDYSGKVSFILDAKTQARQTTKEMILSLLHVVRNNEAGTIDDHDSEYLHDYRVSIRKIRSILSLIKEVFPEDVTLQLKDEFRNLGTETGPVRDLDVYLLSKEEYISMVPQAQKAGIELLFKDLEKRRKTECAKLSKFLKSKAYNTLMVEKIHFFSNSDDELPPSRNSEKPIGKLAIRTLQKRYAKIIGMGTHIITRDTEDEEVHELRIECKKLRYLLEFFKSLLNQKAVAKFVRQLKHLQDNLGRFNDLCVQQQYMNNYLQSLNLRRKNATEIVTAVGTLIGVLYKEQIEERAKVDANVSAFICEENQQLFNTIFTK